MILRRYKSKDCKKTAALFHDTVHSINSADYTRRQLNAWAPAYMDLSEWDDKLSSAYSIVVEDEDLIVGFGVADDTGYFDLLYTHKNYQGIGVANMVADDIERYVCRKGIHTIITAASITAKPFFEKRGYVVIKEQTVECRGQLFSNFVMSKKLEE